MSTSDLNPRPRRRLLLERLEDRLLFDGVAAAPDAMQPEAAQVEVAQMAEYEATAEINDGQSAVNDSAAEGTGSPEHSRALAAELLNTIDSLLGTVDGELAQSAPSETVESTATLAIEESIIAQVEESVVVPDNPMSRREIVFISTDVYDYEYLSLNLPESVQVALITSDRDGMEQIADALRGESNVDAIHIISHGRAGALFLGGSTVDTASLSGEYADELAVIRAALSDNADVLVYGCNVADGDIGQNFVDALADQAGADIAASTNATGAETKGGDWVLEKTTGTVTTQSLQVKTWDGLLAPISITNVTGTAAVAGTTLATNILGNGITLNSATFSGDNSQAGTFTSATGYTPEWLGYGSGILLSTGNTSQVIGPNTAEGSSVDAPGGLVDADLGLLGQGTSFDATSLTLTFTPTSNRVTLQFTFGSDEYNEYVYSAFNDAMGIWVNGQQMAILPTGETISVNSVNQAATFNPANGNQSRDPFPGNGTFDSASPSLYKSNSVASAAFNTSMDGFTVTMSIIADVTAGVSNTIKIGITDIQDAAWDSWLFIRSASFEAETIAYTDNVTTTVNTPVTIDAKANDWDLQGHALTITHIADIPVTPGGAAVTLGSGATAQLTSTGQILYTPLTGSTQNDIFTYTIQDTTGTTAVGFVNVAIPAPPTVDLNDNGTTADRNNAVTYGLNGAAVAVATSTASVADVNDPTYPLLTLGLGGFVNGSSEILNIGGTDFAYGTAQTSNITVSGTAITVTYNGANSITVARTASGAEISDALMETIIRGVTYRNTATNGTFGDRTINFTVNDGTSSSNTATATISVVNAVPVIDLNDNGTTAARDNSVTFTEGNSPVNIATSTASVIDSNDLTYPSLAITLGGFVGGSSERISIGGAEFTYGTVLTTTVTVGSTTFRVAYNGANGIAITNNASGVEMPDADVETLVRGITYRHLPGAVTSGARTMSFVVNDGTVNSSPAVATINVVGTPMAPTIDLNGNDVGTSGNVRDTFESVAYNRNDGTLTWSANWTEGPSATDAAAGDVRIVVDGTANVLRLGDDSATGQADTIRRSANLSAYTSAVLSFDYRRVALDDGTNDFILIEASSDGTTFTQVGRIEGPTNDATYQSFSVNISAYISANTTIRFTAPTSLGNTDFVLIDNVNIAVSAPAPTGNSASYQIGNSPVRIGSTTGSGVVVTDVNENITQAVVTLSNPQTGDALSVAGTLPSGITAVVSGGGSVVTLSGYGSPAMYKQAIEAIGFANSNQSASLVNRTITVQLTDSTAFTSNTATTTITMIGNAAPTIDLDGGTAGNNYSTSYTEDGAAAPVVNTSAVITDTDDANMESATVVLTNAFAGDVLSFGTLPAGIVGSINTSVPGQITVTLTGSATRADYVAALRAIVYSTTSNTPNTTTRTINITVNDGAANSNTATTSITVAANNDAPTTTNDSVTTPEDVTIVLGWGDFGTYSDPEGTAIASVRITSLPGTGALQFFNGTAWVAVATNQTVTAANITAGNLRFVPVAQQNGSPYTTIGFQVSDGSLFSATSTLTVNVTPVNDAPTSTALVNRTNADGATVSVNVSGSFSDIDAGDTLTFSASGLPTGLSINPTTGVISGTIASNASVSGPYSVTITATDSGSATTSQNFTWTVTNPAPTAVADTGSTTENSSVSGNVLTNDTDPDNDTLTVSAVNGLGANIGIAVAGSNGGTFTIGSNGAYSFNPGTAFDNLAVGQTRTTAVNYTATDSQGGTSTATLTITVTGTNDGPVSTAISNQSNADGSTVTLNVSGNFSDPDTGDALTFSASGLPSGLAINPTTGVITGTIANNASVSGPFAVSVTATDPHGATMTRNFTWTVTNPAPTAVADTGATTENANTSGNVITNDTDPDNDVLTVSAVHGSGTNVGVAVAGTNGGTFTIGATGTYSFNPGTAFDNLAAGQTRTTSVTYTATDSQGGTSSSTLTITVTGANDAPTSTAIANQTDADSSALSLNVAGNFSDADTTNTLTFSATGLPSGLSINPTTGLISGTIASNASLSGPYSVTVTATDNASATTSQTFTWTVTNPAPTAVNDAGATTENASTSGNVITNDTDPDGDTLTVSAVNGLSGNVGTSVTGTNSGTFTIASNGAYSFNPGTAFDNLAVSETRTTSVNYEVSDNQGGTSTATVTVTVTGTNDAPTATVTIAGQSNVDSSTVSLNVSSFFTDADTTDVLSFSATGLPTGLSINATSGLISGVINSSASASGPFSVVVTANDGNGGTVNQSFTWIVTNPAPIASNDSFSIGEDAAASVVGNALTNDSDPDGDTISANAQTIVAGSNGGVFSIAANGNVTFNPNGAFNNLAAGQTRTTTLNYVITDANGATASATITVTVNGANDSPTSTPIVNQTSSDAATVSLNVASNFSDPDTTNTLTFSASGLPSGLSINTTTGLISGTIANNASVTGPYSVTVTATDNAGATTSQNFTWTVTNPAPTGSNDSGATTENATTSGNVITNDADPDNDTLTVSAVNGVGANVGGSVTGTNGGTFTIGSDGAYSFNPGTAFDDLAVGQTRTTSVTYTATDSQGGSSSTTLTITVTGTNDAPVSTALSNRTNADGSTVSVNASGNFSDPDATDTLTFSASGLPAGLSIHPTSGIISGTIASNASVSGPFSVSVTATDPHGATTIRNFTWTVTNPVPTAVADAGSTTENANATGNMLTNDTDPDNDTLTVATVNGSGTNVGIAIAGTNGGTFMIGANGDYSFNPGTSFDDLSLGQSRSTSVTYTATDSQGGTSSTTLTITVNGTNDAPTSTSIANQTSSDAASVTLNVSGNFADVDAGSVLAYSASGLPSGLTINASSGIISGTIASNASVTSPYSATVTATDAHGATTSQSFSWTVTNPAPTAVSNSVATTENSSTSGNVLTNDTDPDNDTLSVSAVNGLAAGVNSNVAGSAGGTFVIASNGAFTFNPGTGFDDLAFGETRTTSVNYTATDSQGGSSTTTLTVTVTGTNDLPTSTAIGNQSSIDAANVTLDVSSFFDDLDATDVLTYSASGLPSGLSINAATGIITGTIANSASVTGPYSVEVSATDSQGATTTQTLTWAVTNPGPTATADSNTTTENSTVSGNVLTNDTDPDNDVLTVSAVNGSGTNVGTSVTGSNGGTFTIASNGAYSFNPGTAFDDLALGETRTTTVQYTTTDSQGGFSTTTVTIEVDGQNDGPTSTAIGNRTSVDGATVSLNIRSRFSDVDATDVLTFAASGLPTGLSINATTGVISGTIANNASVTAPYSVTVTATDGSGANTSRIFTWNVTNPAPTASNDSATVAINTTGSGNVLSNDTDPDNDALTVVAVNGSGPSVGSNVAGTTGGTFTVLANGNYSFDPGADFDSLAAGESRATSITYTMSDSQGGSSTATVTVTVTGLNASPVGTAIANQTNSDGASVSLNVAGNFSDPNASDVLTFAASVLPSGLSINATTGLISGTIANNASISGPYSVTITVTDNQGASTSQSLTWTVTNPAPTATNDSRTTAENSTASGNVLTNDNDPDNDVLTVASVNGVAGNVGNSVTGSSGGSFTIESNGSYTFNPGTAFDDLAVGQTRTTSVTYLATDSQGGTSSAVLVVTVVGANDAPTSTAVAAQTSADAQTVSLNVAGSFSDADTTDTLTFTASGLPSGLSINTTTGLISGTIANNASVTSPYSVTVTATDNHGATTSQTFAWTVTNPGPTAVADTGTALENGSATGNVLTNDTDPDNDVLTVAIVNGSGVNVGTSIAGTNGGSFTITNTGGYSFNPGTAFDDLAVGQSRTTSVTYTATDSQGGTSSTTLTITVTGTNDGPVSSSLSNRSSADGSTVNVNVSGNFSDPDSSDVLTFAASGLPSGLSINPTTGFISGTIANNASVTGPYNVVVTATDPHGATTSQSFIWTVTNPAPAANNDGGVTTENSTASGNVLTNDTDPDNDVLTVAAVNGVAGHVAGAVPGSNGGTFTINANGTYSFVPGTAFDNLAAGETRTTNVQYTATDSQGGTSTATLTVTITGTNDAPASTAIANQTNVDGASVSLSVASRFSDVDASNVLTFSASGLPSGLSINSATGLISGTIANNASVSGPYSVTVTATDNAGATTSQTFNWIVTNPAPTASNDAATIASDGTASGNVLTNDTDPDNDALSVSAVNGSGANVGSSIAGTNGGSFSIGTNGAWTFNPGTDFDSLGAGQSQTTSITYTMTDSQGGSSTATFTVTVTGLNSAPTSTPIANQTGVDAGSVNLNVSSNFSDPDSGDALTFSASGLPSGLSINPTTGVITGTIASNASVTGPYSVTITATDSGNATTSQSFIWTVTNPAPTAANDNRTTSENSTTSGNVLTNDTDPDNDTLTVSAVNGVNTNVGNAVAGSSGGTFTVGSNGAYSFNPGTAFDNLAVGQTRTTSVTYTATDSQGGTSTATLTITVTGTNDGPISTAISNQSNSDGSSVTVNVSGNFSDPDTGDALTFSASGLPSGLSINPATGIISGTIANNASVSGPFAVSVSATDPHGATTTHNFTWTVTNPAPTAVADARTTSENTSTSGTVLTNDTDPDNDVLTVSAVNGTVTNVGTDVTGTNGGTFTIGSTGAYTFNPGSAFDDLAVGQTRTTSVTYTATDSQGGTSSTTLTITVTGVNDGPTSTAIAAQSSNDAQSINLNVSGNFADPDAGAVFAYSANGLPSGLSINAATGIISGTIASNASVTGPYSVTVTATDEHGAATSQTFAWAVSNPGPTAVADTRTTSENTSTSGNVLTNDTDPDNDTLSVASVNGVTTNVGAAVAGSNGGTFVINSNGSYTFNPGTAFNDLAVGQSRTSTVTYAATDSQGGTSSTTLTITVTGSNDAPVSALISTQNSSDGSPVVLNVAGNFTDPDTTDPLTFSATGLPSGLLIHPTTGVISGTIANNASVSGPYSVVVTAADPHGGTTSQTFVWNVTNPTPTANNDAATVNENSTSPGNVLSNDTDPDGDTLTVQSVNGLSSNVSNAVAGSNGGTFTIQPNGSYVFNPGSSFDDLAVGETRTSSVTYTMTDNQGGTSTATVTVTVTGLNDAPTSTPIATQNGIDNTPVALNVSTSFGDPDASDPLTFSASNLPSGLSINPTTGIITGTIAGNASVSGPYSVTITAVDPHGGTTSQTFTWNVSNPAPTAANDSATTSENASTTGNVLTNDTDPDGDTLVVSAVNGSPASIGTPISGSQGGTFTIQPNGSYLFQPGTAFDGLAVGQTRTSSITYTVSDNQGGTSTATVTVTVVGRNDAPTSTPIGTQSANDGDPVTLSIASHFGDPDTIDTLTFGASNLPPGLTIDPSTGLIHGTINSNASVSGPYSVTVTATDPHGATTSQTFTWNVANPAPTATNDPATANENSSITGNVLTNDSDPDNDALVVSAVNGSSSNLGRPISGTTGGTFVIQSNGGYSFNPGTSFDHLGVGQSVVTSVTYTVSDGQGGTSTATVSITVTGTNDTPIVAAIPAQDSTGRDVINLDVSSFFSDAETHEPLTFAASNLPPGLSINPTTGLIIGSIDPNAASTGPYSVTVTGTDIHGASVTTSFQWNVENPDLMVLVNDSVPSVNAGDTVVFSVNYANISNRDASGVVITQTLPAQTTFNSAASTAGWINNGDGTYSYALGNVDAHDNGTILFAVTVADTLPSGIDQTSTSSSIADDGSHGNDLTPFNNIASDVTSIDARPDYRITIDDSKTLVYRGETLTYNIHVSNIGSQNGTGVVVTSYFPPEVLGSITASHGGVINTLAGTITWNLSALPAGSDVNLTVSGVIPMNAPTSILNFAQYVTVTDDGSNGADRTPSNNSATDSNFLMSFGFDSFGNRSEEGFGMIPPSAPPLTTKLMPLPVDPIFSGITEPGTTLMGRIYDQHGNLIGERQIVADSSGNWMMSFPNSIVMENPHRMEVQQTAAIQSGVQSGFNFRRYFHPTAHSSIFFSTELSVNEVFRRSAYQMIDQLHEGNESPYGFNWYALAYELAAASSNAGEG